MKRGKRVAAYMVIAAGVLAGLTFTNYAPAYLVRADGQNMEPTLYHGDLLLFTRMPVSTWGVVLYSSEDGPTVKRLASWLVYLNEGDWKGFLTMKADNPTVDEEFSVTSTRYRGRLICPVWLARVEG